MTESPLAEYDAQIADLRTQIHPLQDRLSAVFKERSEYADLLAEDTDDPQTLAGLREESQVAYRKFVDHVRATTHAGIWNFTDWRGDLDDHTTPWLIGPHLSLAPDADAQYVADLAASMIDFATRFCPSPPQNVVGDGSDVNRSGMVFADVLARDYGEAHSFALWYTPDGTKALLIDRRSYRGIEAEGTLVEVLAYAVKVAHNGH